MQHVREIEVNGLRAMHRFAKSAQEFPKNDLLVKSRLEDDASARPKQKNR